MSDDTASTSVEADLKAELGNPQQISMTRRLVIRTVVLGFLTILGAMLLDVLVMVGREQYSDINDRFPELLVMLRAMTVMTWLEMALMWIRVAVSPRLDIQEAAKKALDEPMAAAVTFGIQTLMWALRLLLMVHLCGFL